MATPLPQGPLPDTSTGTPGVPPIPPGNGVDVASLLGTVIGSSGGGPQTGQGYQAMIAQQQRNLTNSQAQMASDFSQINDLSKAITSATKASGDDEVAIASQKAQGLLAAQNAARSVASSYGGNPDDVSNIMNTLGQQWEQAESDRLAALKVVTDKQSVSFADDPLTWLANKFSINADINKYNDLSQQSDDLYTHLEHIQTLNTATAESMKAIAQTQTAATVAATTDQAAQNASIAANKAQLEGITYNIKGIQDLNQMSQEQVDNAVKAAQTAIAQGHLEVAQQQVSILRDQKEMQANLYQEEIKQKQAQDASDAAMLDSMNRGFATLGIPAMDKVKAFNLLKAGGEPGEIAKQALSIGLMNDAIGKPIIAPTSGNAARILAMTNSPIAVKNPAVKSVTDVLSSAYNFARDPNNAQVLGINPKDPSTLDTAVSNRVKEIIAPMAQNIKPGDTSNIYQAPPLTALATDPNVKNNPLYIKVLAPQVKAGMAETNPNKILSLTVDAIEKGDISLQDASSGMASLFNSAAAMNTVNKDYLRFGLTPQAGYRTTLDMDGTFESATKVDMTNRAQVTAAIVKYMQAKSNINSPFVVGP